MNGRRNTECEYFCYSLPGRMENNIPGIYLSALKKSYEKKKIGANENKPRYLLSTIIDNFIDASTTSILGLMQDIHRNEGNLHVIHCQTLEVKFAPHDFSACSWWLYVAVLFVGRMVAANEVTSAAPPATVQSAAPLPPAAPPPTPPLPVAAVPAPACVSGGVTAVSVVSRQNAMGHWLGDAWVERPAPPGRPLGALALHLSHERRRCGDASALVLHLKLEGPPDAVPSDYQLYKGLGYYKAHTEKMNWINAKEACELEGAHLVILNSPEEAQIIAKMVNNLGGSLFIGVSDRHTEGHFVTVFGEPLEKTGYVNWAGPEPNGGKGENCVNIYATGHWNDLPCDRLLSFVCEHPGL